MRIFIRYITKAYQVFENWPHNFHQFLDKKSKGDVRFNPRDGKLDTALKEEFGALFKRLYCDLREPQFDFLREAFAQYLNNRLRAQYEDEMDCLQFLHPMTTNTFQSRKPDDY